jgi:hypothetical protein
MTRVEVKLNIQISKWQYAQVCNEYKEVFKISTQQEFNEGQHRSAMS